MPENRNRDCREPKKAVSIFDTLLFIPAEKNSQTISPYFRKTAFDLPFVRLPPLVLKTFSDLVVWTGQAYPDMR
ncbi:MAG: hypothetical protein R2941_19950 [Desulfobacterales bacterium]